jgi:hypothetical protein
MAVCDAWCTCLGLVHVVRLQSGRVEHSLPHATDASKWRCACEFSYDGFFFPHWLFGSLSARLRHSKDRACVFHGCGGLENKLRAWGRRNESSEENPHALVHFPWHHQSCWSAANTAAKMMGPHAYICKPSGERAGAKSMPRGSGVGISPPGAAARKWCPRLYHGPAERKFKA